MKYLKTLAILLTFVFVITGAECVLAAKTVTIKVGHGHSVSILLTRVLRYSRNFWKNEHTAG
ncbi:hypothetical protein DRI96_05515 [Candidatus Aerophobetes bacterium]|uniref:Uncharacterized protein n=1 Tax=Aerophobetes bacterium TaxID=2030807 RepID=A0A662D7W0_UNCAE|nr:MAG: hypothetical protein DRI96_05515 [Candidatus Aerophobetes bacterium]